MAMTPLSAADGELFQLDTYYRQLITSEREGTNKVIQQKLAVYKRELEIQWQKKFDHANQQETEAQNQFMEFQQLRENNIRLNQKCRDHEVTIEKLRVSK